MKISTEIGSASKIVGEEKAIEYYAKAGFDAWDFSMFQMCGYDWEKMVFYKTNHPLSGNNYLAFARKLRNVGHDNGIVCNQSHAPFPTSCTEIRSCFKRAIECTAEVGGEICVIHPDSGKSVQENREIYMEILPFAKEHNVKIAMENMWSWDREQEQAVFAACSSPESFNAYLDAVNDEYLTACLDIGHAEMRGLNTSAVEMIKALGKRLSALHIHDNDQWHDSHQIPFSMNINFEEVVTALRQINYSGHFTLEADRFLDGYTKENIYDGIKELQKSARRLADMFENVAVI